MILVIGGAASGKRAYVENTLGYAASDMSSGAIDSRPVVMNLESLVASAPGQYPDLLPRLLTKEVVACNETGSGIVPVDAARRAASEETGRLCILLAEKAEKVVRLVCGIPIVIKGQG